MGKLVVLHPVGKDMAPEAMTPLAKAIKAACTTDAYWVKSTYLPEEGNGTASGTPRTRMPFVGSWPPPRR